jgi:hypothetical protein
VVGGVGERQKVERERESNETKWEIQPKADSQIETESVCERDKRKEVIEREHTEKKICFIQRLFIP